MAYRAAIFDFDGTLCNTLPDLCNAANYALAECGFPPHPLESYRYFVGEGVVRLMENILPPDCRSEEQVRALLAVYSAYYSAHSAVDTAPYPGICEMLAALREKGVLLCVLSNKDDGDTRALTAHYFGEGLFSLVCGRREGRPRKPAPDVPLEMARELGVPPEQILFIGDSKFDILTGKNAGMGTCGVLWGFRDRAELEAEGADSIVAAPEELIALF